MRTRDEAPEYSEGLQVLQAGAVVVVFFTIALVALNLVRGWPMATLVPSLVVLGLLAAALFAGCLYLRRCERLVQGFGRGGHRAADPR